MYDTPNQLTSLQDSHIDFVNAVAGALLQATEKLTNLNLMTARAMMASANQTTETLLDSLDAQQALACIGEFTQPVTEKMLDYSRNLYGIASTTNSDLSRIVAAGINESNEKISELIEMTLRTAPAGSGTAVSFIQSAIAASKPMFDAVSQATTRASEFAASNVTSAATVADAVVKTRTRKAA
jgi:phasin family protein